MMFKNIIYFTILSIFALFSCDPATDTLKISNKAKCNVYLFYSCDSTLNDLTLFRNGYYKDSTGDSSYVFSKNYIVKDSIQFIPKRGLNGWVKYIRNCKNKEVHFYFFTDSIVNKYSDDVIKSKRLYESHLKYTEKELEQINWIVTFR